MRLFRVATIKHKRDFKALEKRRLEGARLLARGVSKSEVARQLGVARQTVAAWEQRLMEGGKAALKRSEPGRPRQLDAEQEGELGKIIRPVLWPQASRPSCGHCPASAR